MKTERYFGVRDSNQAGSPNSPAVFLHPRLVTSPSHTNKTRAIQRQPKPQTLTSRSQPLHSDVRAFAHLIGASIARSLSILPFGSDVGISSTASIRVDLPIFVASMAWEQTGTRCGGLTAVPRTGATPTVTIGKEANAKGDVSSAAKAATTDPVVHHELATIQETLVLASQMWSGTQQRFAYQNMVSIVMQWSRPPSPTASVTVWACAEFGSPGAFAHPSQHEVQILGHDVRAPSAQTCKSIIRRKLSHWKGIMNDFGGRCVAGAFFDAIRKPAAEVKATEVTLFRASSGRAIKVSPH